MAERSIEDAAIAYLGIGAHFGGFRSQNARGHLLGHVKDLGLDIQNPKVRYYQTNKELEFHTDSCDIVGLLCLKTAKAGGGSRIVSSVTLHDRMLAETPESVAGVVQPDADRPAWRGAAGHAALVRDPGLQLACGQAEHDLFRPVHPLGAGEFPRSATAFRRGACGTRQA